MNSGDIPVTIFLDLSKAFDTLNHSILLDKLKHYGIKDCVLNLLHSYLTDRQQFVQTTSNLVLFQIKQVCHKDLFLTHFNSSYI